MLSLLFLGSLLIAQIAGRIGYGEFWSWMAGYQGKGTGQWTRIWLQLPKIMGNLTGNLIIPFAYQWIYTQSGFWKVSIRSPADCRGLDAIPSCPSMCSKSDADAYRLLKISWTCQLFDVDQRVDDRQVLSASCLMISRTMPSCFVPELQSQLFALQGQRDGQPFWPVWNFRCGVFRTWREMGAQIWLRKQR